MSGNEESMQMMRGLPRVLMNNLYYVKVLDQWPEDLHRGLATVLPRGVSMSQVPLDRDGGYYGCHGSLRLVWVVERRSMTGVHMCHVLVFVYVMMRSKTAGVICGGGDVV